MYNMKVLTYPDLSRQVKLYKVPVKMGYDEPEKKCRRKPINRNPFDGVRVRDFDNDDDLKEFERYMTSNANRSKNKIYQYAKSNTWEWFTTFTFDKNKVDRMIYDACVKALSKWLNNMRVHSPALAYLIVPEQHRDGAYHFHGLFSGCEGLKIMDTGKVVISKFKRGERTIFKRTEDKIYIFERYKFGYMTATRVKDNNRVTKYITKYVTKDLMSATFGKKRYWASRNLLLPVEEVELIEPSQAFVLKHELIESSDYHKHVDVSQYANQEIDIFELS